MIKNQLSIESKMSSLPVTTSSEQSSSSSQLEEQVTKLVLNPDYLQPTTIPRDQLESVVRRWFSFIPNNLHLKNRNDGKELKLPIEYVEVFSHHHYNSLDLRSYPDRRKGLWNYVGEDGSESSEFFWKQSTAIDIMTEYLLQSKKLHGGILLNFSFETKHVEDEKEREVLSSWLKDQKTQEKNNHLERQERRKQEPNKIFPYESHQKDSDKWDVNFSLSYLSQNIRLLTVPYDYNLTVDIFEEDTDVSENVYVKFQIRLDIPKEVELEQEKKE
jgi:hypothetical protein